MMFGVARAAAPYCYRCPLGLSRETFGVPYETLIGEYEDLPLKDSVKDKWFYKNARRFFRLD